MQIERILTNVETLGPGKRLVIWVNGCFRNCDGCVSKRLQKFDPENECEIISVLSQFNFKKIDGVTISGGEPFEQVKDLRKTVEFLKSNNIDDILIYTGYTYEELLKKNNQDINYILSNIAVLIDGPYIKSLDDGKGNLKGSSNQKIIYLNEKFKNLYLEYYKEERSMQEFSIYNLVIGVGIPNQEYISKFNSK